MLIHAPILVVFSYRLAQRSFGGYLFVQRQENLADEEDRISAQVGKLQFVGANQVE
jgi:hypothetical protein